MDCKRTLDFGGKILVQITHVKCVFFSMHPKMGWNENGMRMELGWDGNGMGMDTQKHPNLDTLPNCSGRQPYPRSCH
jgi:hypothetical protein